MSIMTSGSFDDPPEPTFIAMMRPSKNGQRPMRQVPPRGGGSVIKPTFAIPASWHA
jgi:hypothetical protein